MGVGALGRARAVFLDRDGVLNRNVYYADSGEWESPRRAGDLKLVPAAPPALRALQENGFLLFVVSNQPSMAKGKVSQLDLDSVRAAFETRMSESGVRLTGSYYCLHHPHGVVPEYSVACNCRKPSPFFLFTAAGAHGLDLARSWMVGDRDTDIECGKAAGVATIQVQPDHAGAMAGRATPDHRAATIGEAAAIILQRNK